MTSFTSNELEIINKTSTFIKNKLQGEASGHDWWHVYRVWNNAKLIAFLGSSLQQATRYPIDVLQAVILGLAAYYASSFCIMQVIPLLAPGFSNYNDEAIFAMNRGSDFLLVIGTVVLVPPVEECLYRGLVFRNLYGKSKWAAYFISILLFAMIHILGYIGQYSPLELVLAVLQYLPAGLWLAWCYAKSETIFAPIFMHAAINYITIRTMR